jgi:hypothetical protein
MSKRGKEFSIKPRYGHDQKPAVIGADDELRTRATVMTQSQFDGLYSEILDSLVAQGKVKLDAEKKPIWLQSAWQVREKAAREAAARGENLA